MPIKMTPALLARGSYELRTPFSVDPSVIYTCQAIRSFQDIYKLGKDVYREYYQPNGISAVEFSADHAIKANIITLMTDNGGHIIYVPDTYIVKYPNMNGSLYNHVVLSASLGPVPDKMSLDYVRNQISGIIANSLGINATVQIHQAAFSGMITPDESDVLEANRLAGTQTQRSDYARVITLQQEKQALQQRITALEQIIIANGLLS